jgi:response regulator RpfG family c-di-GMP phosphodiesterase
MPHQDGLAVIRQVKAVNPGQRIILITGCIDESIEQQGHQQGADAVLRKPFDCDEVVRVIRSLVELSLTAPKREPGDVERLPAASV